MRRSGRGNGRVAGLAPGWAFALAGLLAGCGSGPGSSRGSAPVADTASVWAEFLYLPDRDRMVATLTPDSTVVERRNAADSLLASVRRANTAEADSHYDSALHYMGKVAPGEYRREHVIDGTRIRLRHRGAEVLCDNCLHDYVLEAAGATGNKVPSSAETIRGIVRHVSSMVMLAEGKSTKGMRVLAVTLDRSQMKDSTRSYQVDNPRAGTR